MRFFAFILENDTSQQLEHASNFIKFSARSNDLGRNFDGVK